MSRTMLIAGNWKMNGLGTSLGFFEDLLSNLTENSAVDVLICPPATLLSAASAACRGISETLVSTGGQDCHWEASGAHTGDVSAQMLFDAGADYVIVGHSERRMDHKETSEMVRKKAEIALKTNLTPIICVGETHEQRIAGQAETVVAEQVKASLPASEAGSVVIAYEPVWAIGTGLVASLDDIASMHAHIRSLLPDGEATKILYGGSVKPGNARNIFELQDVDGALVGGASLEANSFSKIVSSAF